MCKGTMIGSPVFFSQINVAEKLSAMFTRYWAVIHQI